MTTTDVREEASEVTAAKAMESRFDAIDRKLVDIDLNLERRSAGLRNDLATVRLRIVELHEHMQERLFEVDRRLYRLTRDIAALKRDAPAGAPGAGHGEPQDAAPR
ncbi:hypothetical protein [Candidatus Palauibacter sp.]|uniref:hypothetical protein n=1 Tax=Candidatus Palauibacter sp. TaxID=3101350 RepID=UPI003B0183F5